MKRLAIFLADLDGGGAERMMVALANGLVARDIAVDMLLARATGPYLSEVVEGVTLTDLGSAGVAAAVAPLARYLRRARPDLLLTTLPHSSAAALAARFLSGTGIPVVVREANTPTASGSAWSSPKDRLADIIMRRVYRTADGVMSVSDGVTRALEQVVGLPSHTIATLYNPVVSPELPLLAAADVDHPWFGPERAPVILGVGSLSRRKDFHTLVRAFDLVARRRKAKLIILGEGPERSSLEALVAELGRGDDVDLPGFTPNPFAFMRRAAVYVLSSRLEGLPGSLVQALACGCPSVATDCPSGPAEILQHGALGPLVPVGDVEAMAAAIEAQLVRPTPGDALTAGVAKYDADTVLDNVAAYLHDVSATRHRASSRRG